MIARVRGDSGPMRLLPGEAADSEDLEDAVMWAAVYDELCAFIWRRAPDLGRELLLQIYK